MPPKASGKGRKKAVQEKAAKAASEKTAKNNIESYFSPSKKIPDEAIESNDLLNGKVEPDHNEKSDEIIDKQNTKQGKKGGKLNAAENISNDTEKDSTVSNLIQPNKVAPIPKRGRKKLKEEVNEKESNLEENIVKPALVNGKNLDTLNVEKPVEIAEKMEEESLTKEDGTGEVNKKGTKKRGKKNRVPSSEETFLIQKNKNSEPNDGKNEHSDIEEGASESVPAENSKVSKLSAIKEESEVTRTTEAKEIEREQDEENVPAKAGTKKRGKKNVNVPSNDETFSIKKNKNSQPNDGEKEHSDIEESAPVSAKPNSKVSKSSAIKGKSEETDTAEAKGSKRKQDEEDVPAKAGRKRKNVNAVSQKEETRRNKAAEKMQSALNTLEESRVLKVALKRSKSIDELVSEENDKMKKKGKKDVKKPTAKGKRAKAGDEGTSDIVTKPVKKLKEETKSKGQSKKDKMPDVTVLDFSNTSTSPTGKAWNMKLASWNVNGVRAWLEKDGLVYLKHESPDIMCIQETKCSDDKLPTEVNVEGYHSYWLAGDKDGYSGVGLLSKKKPLSVKYGIGMIEYDCEGRVITAEYDEFFLITAYVPNAGRGLVRLDYRMLWDKDFRSYIKNLDESKPIILCGDLNVSHEEIDLANPKGNKKNAGFTEEEREGFSTLLSEGFVDTFRHLYPDQKAAYTFWTYMMNARAKNVGWRLDYFVISKRFIDNLCDSVIRKDVFGSDHCPIALFISI